MLTLSNVETHYGSSQALFGVSLNIKPAGVSTLLGRNGMGKTTTISSIMNIKSKTSGYVSFNGQDITNLPSFKIAKLGIGLVPEGRQIFPNLTTHENLIATANITKTKNLTWTLEHVYELFPDLKSRAKFMGNLLSGGEQQMLAIGRALLTNPKLLILDEATEGLAPIIREKIWEALRNIRDSGISILIIDKNLKDLLTISDNHNIIHKGKIVWSGSSAQLRSSKEVTKTFLVSNEPSLLIKVLRTFMGSKQLDSQYVSKSSASKSFYCVFRANTDLEFLISGFIRSPRITAGLELKFFAHLSTL